MEIKEWIMTSKSWADMIGRQQGSGAETKANMQQEVKSIVLEEHERQSRIANIIVTRKEYGGNL
jgi:hypothetical protein